MTKYLAPQVAKPAAKSLTGFKLVGIVGKARTGKDTLAKYLVQKRFDQVNELYVESAALADAVKSVASAAFLIPIADFYDYGAHDREKSHPQLGFSCRQAAQFVGTESFREIFGEWIWVSRLHRELQERVTVVDAIVVTDVRFENEVRWILDQDGIVVYLDRDDAEIVSPHASENTPSLERVQELQESFGGDIVHLTNNGSKLDLYAAIEARLVPLLQPA